MNTDLLIIFIILNVINVIMQTFKNIITIKGGKLAAALINAIAFGFYTVVTVYLLCDLPLLWKAIIVGLCNLIGVYVVKLIEEKVRKDKLWKVELTVKNNYTENLIAELKNLKISFNYIENIGNYTMFNIFCATQKESLFVKDLTKKYEAKYFVTESKNL